MRLPVRAPDAVVRLSPVAALILASDTLANAG
jgi:hypothetical protein